MVLQPVQLFLLATDLLSVQPLHLLQRDPAQQIRAVSPGTVPGDEHPVQPAAPLARDHAEQRPEPPGHHPECIIRATEENRGRSTPGVDRPLSIHF